MRGKLPAGFVGRNRFSEEVVLSRQTVLLMLLRGPYCIPRFFSQNLLSDNHILGAFSGTWEHSWGQNRYDLWFLGTCSLVGGTAVNQAPMST